jgi:hypothetical protein
MDKKIRFAKHRRLHVHLVHGSLHVSSSRASIAASLKALLVVAGGLVIGVDNGVGGDSLSILHLSPGVDGIDIAELIVSVNAIAIDSEHGALEGRELTNVLEPK